MKLAQIIGYALAFGFIALCAVLTARFKEEPRKPQPAPTALGVPGGGMPGGSPFSGSWSLEDYFQRRDTDGDGRLSREESAAGWSRGFAESEERSQRMFDATDTDGDGYITLEESRAFWAAVRESVRRVSEAFAAMDLDGDGRVSLDEYLAAAGTDDSDEALADASERFNATDRDGDGYIDAREMRLAGFRMDSPIADP